MTTPSEHPSEGPGCDQPDCDGPTRQRVDDQHTLDERWPEMARRLDRVLADRTGAATVLVGEAGIGKTFLLDAIERVATDAGARLLRISGHATERQLALAGLHGLLHQIRHELDALDALATPHRNVLDRALAGAEHVGTEVALGAALLAVLAGLAESQPIVLLVDDTHWIDESSLRSLAFAVRRLRSDPVLVVFATRPIGGLPLDDLPAHHLPGLGFESAARLLTQIASAAAPADATPGPETDPIGVGLDPDVARRCWEASEGNPLALAEFARRLDDAQRSGSRPIDWHRFVPDRLIEVLAERIMELPAATRRALLGLAVTGGDRWLDAALGQLAASRVDLAPAESAGLVTLGTSTRFVHPLHASAVLASADAATIRALHRQLGQAIDDPDRAAWHAACGTVGPDAEVAELVQVSARRARERGMVSTAAQLHEQAAELSDDRDLAAARRLDAASAWWFASRPTRTLDLLRPILHQPLDAVTRAEVALRFHTADAWLGSASSAAHQLVDEAIRVRPSSCESAVSLACAATGTAALAADLHLAATASDLAVQTAEQCRGRRRRQISGSSDDDRNGNGDNDDDNDDGHEVDDATTPLMATTAQAFARLIGGDRLDPHMRATFEAVRHVPLVKLSDDQLDMVQFVGFALLVDERPDEAIDVFEALRREAAHRGVASAERFAAAMAAEAYRRRGEWTIADVRAAPEPDTDLRSSTAHDLGLAVRARLRAHQGIPDAHEPARVVLERTDRVGLGFVAAIARSALAAAHLAAGDAEAALVHLDRIDRDVEQGGGFDTGSVWFELDRLDALARIGRPVDLRRFVDRLRRHADHTGRAWSTALASAGQALLGAEPSARQAIEQIDRLSAPFEAARLRLLLAEHGLIDPADLTTAVDDLDRLAARPWADRVRALVPGRWSTTDLGSDLAGRLSPAELRVALAVAGGRSNRETATDLHLSPRTVEAHLRSIFRKLDIHNRTALAALVLRTLDDARRLDHTRHA